MPTVHCLVHHRGRGMKQKRKMPSDHLSLKFEHDKEKIGKELMLVVLSGV